MMMNGNKKPVGLFLGTREAINNAYAPEVQQKIGEHLAMVGECYCNTQFENREADPALFAQVEYIFSTWNMPKLTAGETEMFFPRLKAVFYAAGTVQYFAKGFMERGVKIFSAWGANGVPVAETTVAEILLANKGFFQTLHRGGGAWTQHDAGKPYPGNYNTRVGIIGAGMIGSLVIKMLKAYRLNVLVFDPFLPAEKAEEWGVEKTEDITELFARCQVISNHLADNPQTRNMITAKCFDRMGENAVFLNTGRGRQVNEGDLIAALKSHPHRAAVLDVTYPEPPAANSELYTMPNVFLTPHLAGSVGNEVARMGQYMYEEFVALLQGKATRYEVSEKMLATMA